MSNKTYLIYGMSKGLGKAITLQLPDASDTVFGISRSKPAYLNDSPHVNWISADLSKPEQAVQIVIQAVGVQQIDYLIYNVGIWESNAFSEDYDFAQNTAAEISNMINTNITACILNIQAMLNNLKLSENAKVILIGSTWGLDNHKGKEVTFSASKYALRGIVHALRENLRKDKIAVSILNLGYLATEFDNNEDVASVIQATAGDLIPLQDVMHALRFIIATSSASCVKEITMPAMNDENV